MSATVRNPKWEFTFNISGAPLIRTTSGGEEFVPFKCVVTDFKNRCKVTVSGIKRTGMSEGRSKVFYLGGYEKTEALPGWLLELIKEAGFPVRELEET